MEEGYLPVKMKRKDLEEVNDEFSDFSLSSPARKIRRLDAELPPIIEEEETVNPVLLGQSVPPQDTFVKQVVGASPISIDELRVNVPENEERAIVLFNPVNNSPLLQSRSPFSISVDSDFLSGLKNPVLWSNEANVFGSLEGKTGKQDDNSGQSNGCLAVVPWVPSHSNHPQIQELDVPHTELSEMMDSEDTEATSMDIEGNDFHQIPQNEIGVMSVSEGLNQWQQHCMIPQPPHNLSTPITWFR